MWNSRTKRLRLPVRLRGARGRWGWWISSDEEHYQGPYDTREEAIRCAIREGLGEAFNGHDDCARFYILFARQGPVALADYLDADAVLESASERIDEELGGDDGLDWDFWTREQEKQLDKWLGRLVMFWQWWNGIRIKTWAFTHTAHAETYTHVRTR